MMNQFCLATLAALLLIGPQEPDVPRSAVESATLPDNQHYEFPQRNDDRYQTAERLHLSGDGDYVIENRLFIADEGEYAIRVDNHQEGTIVIRNCVFRGRHGPGRDGLQSGNGGGILTWQSNNVIIENNYFEYIQGFGIRVMGSREHPSRHVQVRHNDLYCLQAEYTEGTPWGWTADAIQFIRVAGPDNCILGNRCINRPGTSYLTDYINVYCSSGTAESPLLVMGNLLVGAGSTGLYNQYGCGIQLNDHPADEDAGQYVEARDNLLIDPGIVGININGGLHAIIQNNHILMSNQLRTNLARGPVKEHPAWAAVTLFNYSGGVTRDEGHAVRGNAVAFRQPDGTFFINRTQPESTVVEQNDWDADCDWHALIQRRLRTQDDAPQR